MKQHKNAYLLIIQGIDINFDFIKEDDVRYTTLYFCTVSYILEKASVY